jgi:cytochrome b subunit of formate dehydrogenase
MNTVAQTASRTGAAPPVSPTAQPVPLDAAQRGEGPFVWRFNLYHRVTHATVMVSFFTLVATGLPLRFSGAFWAPTVMKLLGGVHMAGRLHRTAAAVTFGYFLAHIAYVVVALVRARPEDRKRMLWGRESMVPHTSDFVHFFQQFRWFLGIGPRPHFGRYSYMEKFDYLAVFWGVAMIGTSGLFLWFPEFFARFLPGWVFNVATIIHADEAVLATAFIFTIHFFNVHLRPEKFPLDAVMFTGRATKHYMVEEHPGVADRIEALEAEPIRRAPVLDAPAPAPSHRLSLVGAILGFAALAVGLALIGMMLWVALS